MIFFMLIMIFILNLFIFWNKWISLYFFNEKMMSCRLIHYAQTTCIRLNTTQFFSMNRLKINNLILFTKSMIMIFTFILFNNFSKSALKNKYKWKTLMIFMTNFYVFYNILLCVVKMTKWYICFSQMTLFIWLFIQTFFFQILCNNCLWLIIENMWITFMFNNVIILSFF